MSTQSFAVAHSDLVLPQVASPKITAIVDEISKLTLLEVADLTAQLKVTELRTLDHANIRLLNSAH
jgi:hypothetical protein